MHLNDNKNRIFHFIRHGKSSWKYPVDDKIRPLKKRGISDITLIANQFLKLKIKPDLVVSSPAKRALDTCRILMKILEISKDILQIKSQLYDFEGSKTLNFIKNLDNSNQIILLFGHNDAFTNLINHLGSHKIDNLPTSGLVAIHFDVNSWSEISNGSTITKLFPKDYK